MKYRIFFLFLFICASIGCYNFLIHPACSSAPVAAAPQKTQKILLVPLDGRPPCRKFVLDAGELAGAEILTPPGEIQDYYTQPGDTKALAPWLEENIEGCDAMILSIDQLLYGGLLAAREANKTPAEMTALLDFLRRLHAIPVEACPFSGDHAHRLAIARARIDAGLVDVDDFDEERRGWTAEAVWNELNDLLPLAPDPVVAHGDFSLDNLIVEGHAVVGCIDVGRTGIADRYQDLAILWNCLHEFGPALQARLLRQYGFSSPDRRTLQFHLTIAPSTP